MQTKRYKRALIAQEHCDRPQEAAPYDFGGADSEFETANYRIMATPKQEFMFAFRTR